MKWGIGKETIWNEVKGQALLGEDEFVDSLADHLRRHKKDIREIPKSQRYANRPALDKIFSQRILDSCCRTHRLPQPSAPFVCTVKLARTIWSVYPTRLPDVCRHLRIPLQHHEAGSDAEACARIVIAARKAGWEQCGREAMI